MRPNQSMSDRTISEGSASMKISRKFFRRNSRWQRARKHSLMLPLFVTAAVAGGIMRPHSAHADTVNWLGPNGTINWDAVFQDMNGVNHTYWSNNSVPQPGSDVVNSNALAGIQLTNNYTINSLLSAGAFTINAGGLTGNQANAGSTIQVNNLFTIDGGYLSNFTVNAGTGGQGVTFSGNGNNYIQNCVFNSRLDFGTGAFTEAYNANVINNMLAINGGQIRLHDSNASLTVGANGSIVGTGTLNQFYGGTTLTNNGLINANVNGQTLTTSLDNFTSTGTLQADNGGTLALLDRVNVSGIIQATNGGTVAINNALISASGTTVHGDTGTVLVDGGNVSGTFTTTGSGLTFSANGGNYLSNTTLNSGQYTFGNGGFAEAYNANTINGLLNMGGGQLRLHDSNASLTVGANGSIVGTGTLNQFYGGATLTNNGLINANQNGSALNISLSNFNNVGTAEATNGATLAINSNTNLSGVLQSVGSGSQVTLSGSLTGTGGTVQALSSGQVTIASAFTGNGTTVHGDTGTVLVDGGGVSGTFNTTGSGLTFSGSGGNFIGHDTSTSTITGNLTFGSGFSELYNADTFQTGTLSLAGGQLRLHDSNASLTLANDYTLAGYGTINQFYGGTILTNNGLINANATNQTLTLSLDRVTNTGTLQAGGGNLVVNSSLTDSGVLQATGGGTLTINGLLTAGNDVIYANGGTVLIDGAGVTGTISTTTGSGLTFSANGGNYLSNTTLNSGQYTFGNGGFAEAYNANTINGLLNMGGGQLRLHDSNASLTVGANGSIVGTGTLNQFYGGATLTNNGTVTANVSGQTLNVGLDNIVGGGTFRADNSTLAIGSNNFASTNATLQAVNNGTINLTGVLTGSNFHVNAAGGTVSLTGGLTGSIGSSTGAGLNFTSDGGNYLSNATVNAGGIVTFGTGGFAEAYNANTINGLLNMGGGQLRLHDSNASLTVGANGSIVGTGTLNQFYGGTTLTNNGTVTANTNGQTLTISPDNVTNTGTMQATNGATLTTGPRVATSGTLRVDSGSTLNANGGITQTAGTTHANGSLTLAQTFAVQGGTVQGTGTITGDIVNTGGTLKPGDVGPGTLTQTGSYTQSAGGVFLEQLGGTTPGASGVFSLTGNAALDGTLDVQLANGFHPIVNQSFVFLNYGQRVNTPQGVPSTFASVVSLDDGFSYTVAYDDTAHDATLTVITASAPVPETGTMVSLGLMLGLGGWMIRRRRTAVTTDTLPQPAA